jgi:hypothetical protein
LTSQTYEPLAENRKESTSVSRVKLIDKLSVLRHVLLPLWNMLLSLLTGTEKMTDQPHHNALKQEETKGREHSWQKGVKQIGLWTDCRAPARMEMDMHQFFN